MSFNMKDYVSDDHIESIGEIAKSQSAIIQALSLDNSKLEREIERLNNKEEQLIRRLEDLIVVGEQVENEWAVDICKMIIKELKGSDKE